ncbi:MAG: hypothetical protein ABJB16_01540 [Saprospiraceae bacterium]
MIRKLALILFSVNFFLPTFLFGASTVNTEDHPTSMIEMCEMIPDHQTSKMELKELKRNEKRLVRFEHLFSGLNKKSTSKGSKHSSGIFSDPVNRWFWLWIITWGFGIFLLVVSSGGIAGAGIGLIWLLAFGLGSVALILWLVKKFG